MSLLNYFLVLGNQSFILDFTLIQFHLGVLI